MEEVLFTSGAVADLLSQLDEFKDKDIQVSENATGVEIQIDDNAYTVPYQNAEDIEVDESVIEEVADVADDSFANFEDSDLEDVSSGIVKEIAKTLLVGGLVRLSAKLLNK